MKIISWPVFWIAAAITFAVALYFNRTLYIMPDAASVTLGMLLGSYVAGWSLWRVIRFMKKNALPDGKLFTLTIGACLVAYQVAHQFK